MFGLEAEYWKISDFSKKLGKHSNTIDGWFRTLEEDRKTHYINRINNEKIYDVLDLNIAKFIIEKRTMKWSLDGIFDNLPTQFSLRPFPTDFEHDSKSLQGVDVDKVRATIMSELKATFADVVSAEVTKKMEDFQRLLPSPTQNRLDRFNSIVAERKITRTLEEEGLSMWATKSAEERLKSIGWFRKAEDLEKRERFVKSYIDEHFEERLRDELGISSIKPGNRDEVEDENNAH